jgi:hypothetical protein
VINAERASGCAVAQGGPIVKPGWHRFELTFLLLNKISPPSLPALVNSSHTLKQSTLHRAFTRGSLSIICSEQRPCHGRHFEAAIQVASTHKRTHIILAFETAHAYFAYKTHTTLHSLDSVRNVSRIESSRDQHLNHD